MGKHWVEQLYTTVCDVQPQRAGNFFATHFFFATHVHRTGGMFFQGHLASRGKRNPRAVVPTDGDDSDGCTDYATHQPACAARPTEGIRRNHRFAIGNLRGADRGPRDELARGVSPEAGVPDEANRLLAANGGRNLACQHAKSGLPRLRSLADSTSVAIRLRSSSVEQLVPRRAARCTATDDAYRVLDSRQPD